MFAPVRGDKQQGSGTPVVWLSNTLTVVLNLSTVSKVENKEFSSSTCSLIHPPTGYTLLYGAVSCSLKPVKGHLKSDVLSVRLGTTRLLCCLLGCLLGCLLCCVVSCQLSAGGVV